MNNKCFVYYTWIFELNVLVVHTLYLFYILLFMAQQESPSYLFWNKKSYTFIIMINTLSVIEQPILT